jgi:metal-responsive CopG/Arc/MetJ family transcriptional regulator
MAEEKLQVNVDFTGFPELYEALDAMVKEDDMDRSKFIRKMVRQEQARRQQLELPLPTTNNASSALAKTARSAQRDSKREKAAAA